MATKPKRPRDPNQLAMLIVDIATGKGKSTKPAVVKDPAAVALGRKGGLKGGKVRAEKLTKQELSDIGKRGAAKRWGATEQPEGEASSKAPRNRKALSVGPDDKQ